MDPLKYCRISKLLPSYITEYASLFYSIEFNLFHFSIGPSARWPQRSRWNAYHSWPCRQWRFHHRNGLESRCRRSHRHTTHCSRPSTRHCFRSHWSLGRWNKGIGCCWRPCCRSCFRSGWPLVENWSGKHQMGITELLANSQRYMHNIRREKMETTALVKLMVII